MFKEALYYKKLGEKKVHCQLCPHSCVIENGEVGLCKVRQNINGSLKTILFSKPCVLNVKKIERFGFYHVLPDNSTLGLGIAGSNLNQNEDPEKVPSTYTTPSQVVARAKKEEVKVFTYSYGEPTIYYEYLKVIAEKSKNFKHIIVTNGYISQTPLKSICYLIDAANIEIKSMEDAFYKQSYNVSVDSILNAIKTMKQEDVWIEINVNIMPKINESIYDLRKIVSWILLNLGADTPLHLIPTGDNPDLELVKKLRKMAIEAGMNFVYIDSIPEFRTTFCPNCKKPVITRANYIDNKLVNGKCRCGHFIPGIWE